MNLNTSVHCIYILHKYIYIYIRTCTLILSIALVHAVHSRLKQIYSTLVEMSGQGLSCVDLALSAHLLKWRSRRAGTMDPLYVFRMWRKWTLMLQAVRAGKMCPLDIFWVRTGATGYSGDAWPTIQYMEELGEAQCREATGEADARPAKRRRLNRSMSEPPCTYGYHMY